MRDYFAAVDQAATRGGALLGVPDYLDRDEQLRLALRQLAAFHADINALERVVKVARDVAGGAGEPGRAAQWAALWQSYQQGRYGRLALLRGLVKVLVIGKRLGERQGREALTRALRRLDRRLQAVSPAGAALPAERFGGLASIRTLIQHGRYDQAYVLARALMPTRSQNLDYLTLIQQVQTKRGAISSVLALGRAREARLRITWFATRRLEGQVRELAGWYPRLPGGPEPVVPSDERTVMHLVKESRPYLSNGFTSRSHRNFLAEARAGLRPVVLTEPGFPHNVGITDAKAVEFVDGIEHRHLDAATFTAEMAPDSYLQIFAQQALAQVRELRPAVLHASSGRRGYETALVAMALAEKTGLPFVYEVRSFFESLWTDDTSIEESGEIFMRRLAVEQLCLDRADVVLTLGEAMRDELVRRGTDPGKIRLVPNGVDLEAFTPQDRPADLAAELGIGTVPTFGYVSNLDHHRESQETLVRALAVLTKRGIDARCVLVGSGPRTAIVRELAERLQVSDRLVLTGAVDHTLVARYYALIDVFVVPRIDERAARFVTPLKPFEAMALGRPVVVSDLPALREIVAPPQRGLTFPPGDATALAEVLISLFSAPELAARLGQAGRHWVSEQRQWSMNGQRYADAFAAARQQAAARHAAARHAPQPETPAQAQAPAQPHSTAQATPVTEEITDAG